MRKNNAGAISSASDLHFYLLIKSNQNTNFWNRSSGDPKARGVSNEANTSGGGGVIK